MSIRDPDTISTLRKQARVARRAMGVEQRATASDAIANRILRMHEFSAAKAIACYLPMADEADPTRIIARAWRMGKAVFVPLMRDTGKMSFCRLLPETRLVRNRIGIWEPRNCAVVPPRKLDLVITPLVAFDDHCERIGMGGGYYDRCFAFLRNRHYWRRPKLTGIAFDCQRVEKIPANPWDIRLYSVVTESTSHTSSS